MPLTLIEKYKAPTEGEVPLIKTRGVLSAFETKLLADFFVLETLMDPKDKETLRTLCRSIHERDLWIQCHCLTALVNPVFRIKKASSGSLYLHRITSRQDHAEACLFKARVYEPHERDSNARKPLVKADKPFNLLGKKSQNLIKPSEESSKPLRKQGESTPKLASALFHLLEAANLNRVSLKNCLKPQDALLKGAKSLELRKGLFLSDYLELNPQRIKYVAMKLKDDNAWPKGIEKHSLALLRVKSFTQNTLEVMLPDKSLKTIDVALQIYKSSGRLSERSAPYMALILISTTAESPWFYQPVKAYVMPTYSEDSYFPVDSFYERLVLRYLYRLYFEALKKGTPFQIIKPLFDLPISLPGTEKPLAVLPDFLIQKGNKTLVIEVNGSIEEAYLERKARTHEQMKYLGELYCINAYVAESDNQLSQEINRLMIRISQWLSLY